jgi:tetratricopeptide (TPR) repeat protein
MTGQFCKDIVSGEGRGWPCVLLFLVAFLAFANTFGNGWTYDDFPVIVDNPDIRSLAGFLKDSYPGRPLRELTYLLDFSLFGLEPAGWHLQQIFWHGLNACLVFLLGRRLRLAGWAALLAALLFLLHPLQVEVVANLSHRKDSLALAGSLGAILCYLKFLDLRPRRLAWLIGALACLGLACSAKQTALMTPVALFCYELLLMPRAERLLARWPLAWLGLALVGALAGGWWLAGDGWPTFALRMQDTISFKANYLAPVTLSVYYLTVLKSWLFMALRLIWPFDLALEYTFPVPGGLLDPWVLTGLLLLAACLAGLVYGWRRWPRASWLLLSALAFFLPTANLWPLTYLAADRYLYAPLAFFALLAGCALEQLPVPRRVLLAAALAVLVTCAVLSWQQNRVWQSPRTLWAHALKVSPESSFALNNMGNLTLERGDAKGAKDYYQRAARVNPLNPTPHFNLGWLAEQRRDIPEAVRHYRAFARLNHPVYREQLKQLREHLLSSYGVRL